ncbi:MAG: radical SAM protein [Actinomycetota bacterium]|nr:radical SAM protein [Actinomycetota bacterium]
MKFTFIYPDFFQFRDGTFLAEGRIYLGIAYLSAVLKLHGHETSLLHLVAPPEREWLTEMVKKENPDIIGFSSTTHNFRHVQKWAEWLKEDVGVPTICGGVHPTIAPEEVVETPGIDFACRGEAEETLLEFCEKLESSKDPSGVGGIWLKRNGEIIRNPTRPLLTDLDSLPFPDRDIFNPALFCAEQLPRGTVMASRGCPYRCAYCSNHAQRNTYPNPKDYVRYRSPENVVEEIVELISGDPRIEYIRFDDDILNPNPQWLEELSALYRKRVNMPFICNSRANYMDKKTAQTLAEMGCTVVCMGIESGNEWLRKNVLKRRMSDETITRAFRETQEAGLKTVSTNMVGLPLEEAQMILDTIKLNASCRPDTIQVSNFVPYPSTDLFELCKEKGLIPHERPDTIFDGSFHIERQEEGWEKEALKSEFHNLVYLYMRVKETKNPRLGGFAESFLDSVVLGRKIPSRMRKRLFDSACSWAKKRYEPSWIKY